MVKLGDQGLDDGATENTSTRNVQTGVSNGTLTSSEEKIERSQGSSVSRNRDALRRILVGNSSRISLTAEATAHREALIDAIKPHGMELLEVPLDGVYIATDGTNAISLVYNEAQGQPLRGSDHSEFVPAAGHLEMVGDNPTYLEFIANANININQNILVHESDYVNVLTTADQMNHARRRGIALGNAIRNDVISSGNTDLNMDVIFSSPIRVGYDFKSVVQQVDKYSTTGVEPSINCGLVVEVCLDADVRDARSYDSSRNSRNTWTHFMTLGCRSEIVGSGESSDHDQFMWDPLMNLVSVATDVRTPRLFAFINALMCGFMMSNRERPWLAPFRDFDNDMAPNLGALVLDREQRRPTRLNDYQELGRFVNKFVAHPQYAIEARYGELLHPAVAILYDGQSSVRRMLEDVGLPNGYDVDDVVRNIVDYYSGIVVDGGTMVDSRSIDYFRVVNQIADNPALLESFLGYYRPEDRMRAIADAGFGNSIVRGANGPRSMESIYNTSKFIMNASAIVDICNQTDVNKIIRNYRTVDNGAFDFESLRGQGEMYARNDRSGYLSDSGYRNSYGGYFRGRSRY